MNTTQNHGVRMRTCVCASISRLTVAPSPLPPRPVARSVSGDQVHSEPVRANLAHLRAGSR